jgi:23S rRNA G2445 N2-methylase RlmL
MIDWSKWTFTVENGWSGIIHAVNASENTTVNVSNFNKHIKYTDDAAKCIKDAIKKAIRQHYVDKQLENWKGQTLPVEDNLDYIENEPQRRGLV